jgi:sporulation protein YlmC with PRC-barrel domain
VTEAASGEFLLQEPVLLRGIRIGRPTDLVLDLEGLRVVGLELHCGDGVDRFLPYPVARIAAGGILVDSPLQLVEDQDLAFYRRRGTSLRSLQGMPVESDDRELGTLSDVLIGTGGAVAALVVERDGEERRVEVDSSLTIGGRRVASAA